MKKEIKLEWHNEKRKISDLIPYESNPRQITEKQYSDLKKSVTKFNLAEIPAINLDNKICAGHQRLKAMSEVYGNDFEIDVRVPNRKLSEKEFKEYNVRSNKNTAGWEYDILANEFEIEELIEWGFEEKELDLNLWNDTDESKLDEVPEVPKKALSRLGDLFEIDGKHRVLCGDSLDTEQLEILLNKSKADICFFSPPYNAGTTPTEIKMNKKSKYANDSDKKNDSEYLKFICDLTNNALLFSLYCFVNIQSISGNKTALINFLYTLKEIYSDTIIWDKINSQPAMAENVLNSQFEYVHCFSHKANRHIGTKKFRGEISNVLTLQKQNQNEVKNHNATFPVKLAEFIVGNFCENSAIDLCIGSGSTLIACQQTNRICYGMEIDPLYIDVILKRYKKLYPEAEFKCLNREFDFQKLFSEI